MASDSQVNTTSKHPSPMRAKVALGSLWFGILGAPMAWISLELISYILTTAVCDTNNQSALSKHSLKVWYYLLPISVVAGIIALSAVMIAMHNWRKTRNEKSGSAHKLLEVGEGRTRFLAMFGLLSSIGFIVALLFSAITLFLMPLCT